MSEKEPKAAGGQSAFLRIPRRCFFTVPRPTLAEVVTIIELSLTSWGSECSQSLICGFLFLHRSSHLGS